MYKYVIISPVRNEEDYVRKTLESVVNQSHKPVQWIIVNDGSTDNTEQIIDEYISSHSWIHKLNLADRGYYFPGTGVVNVFTSGFKEIKSSDWEYLVKLDCDLEFEQNYFEQIFDRFASDSNLGIASGCIYTLKNNKMKREISQEDHPFGASKVYKRKCWEEIGGILPVPGWDLADLLSAQVHGWNTKCYFDLKIIHFRPGGSRRKGIVGPKFLQGRFAYKHGYDFLYLVLREISHIFRKPVIIGSIAQISGYIYSAILREEYLFPKELRRHLRKRHKKILKESLGLK